MSRRNARLYLVDRESKLFSLISIVLMFVTASCAHVGVQGELISVNLSLESYMRARMRGSGEGESKFSFPELQVYERGSKLIYRGTRPNENARVLWEISLGSLDFKQKPNGPALIDIVEAFPEFKARKRDILRHKLVVLSVALDDCQACKTQEAAMDDVDHQLIQHAACILLVKVFR